MELSGLVRALRLEGPRDGGQPEQPPPAVPPAEQVLLQIRLIFSEGAGGVPKAGVLRDLGALIEAADCRWLFGGVSPATLGKLVAALNGYAAPPEQEQDAADLPSKDSAYAATAERAADVGSVFLHLLAKLEAANTQESLGVPMVGPILCRVMEPLYIFAATHIAERPWTNMKSQSVAQELLALLVRATGCGSVAEFLRGKNEDEEGRFGAVMGLLKQELTKDTWKRNPATKFVFSWTLPQVTRPWLSHYLECVLPPSLLISDDYREENKILGVRCLHHIVLNVAVLLCLLDLVPILERAQRQQKQTRPTTPCDEVLQLVLTHMEAEHRLALRRVYARTLPAFVQRLGILIARHLKRLERVILGYLEVCDGPEEEARLGILETLQCTIEHAWPRMPCRLPVLLKALLKMIWDVHTDQGSTPEPVKAALLQGATECLILLDRCSEGQVKVSRGPRTASSLIPSPLEGRGSVVHAKAHLLPQSNSILKASVSTHHNIST
uniref:TELO2 interacting protein 2 n=1 Tax=Buteo japonicus TaxID=224669 RepID=A0A8C0AQQ5_9AVES